jgi:hypothetical protein
MLRKALRRRLPFALFCLLVLLLPWAEGQACQRCYGLTIFVPMYSCVPVEQYETGYTECTTFPLLGGTGCRVSGDFCSVVDAGGGGSGGGSQPSGGGSTCEYDSSNYCPPWCAACNRVGP